MVRSVQPEDALRYHNIQELKVNELWVDKEGK